MIAFCATVAWHQLATGGHFIIENPTTSAIWNLPDVTDLADYGTISRAVVHMCAYGLEDPFSHLPMRNSMTLLTNIADTYTHDLVRQCPGNHSHQAIVGSSKGYGSRALISQAYPWKFCDRLASILYEMHMERNNMVSSGLLTSTLTAWDNLSPSDEPLDLMAYEDTAKGGHVVFPAMPCVDMTVVPPQNEKLDNRSILDLALVARAVQKREMETQPAAAQAMKKEWSTMHKIVWDCHNVREKSQVIAEAKRKNETIQLGRVHGICVEKNAELPDGHPNRKYTGRVVFRGNRVLNQDYETTSFADLGNSLASLESGRLADAYGALEGHASENADGI
jgi:hypothetical protein